MAERKREIWLDVLRFVAAFLVIVNHTNSGIFMASDPSCLTWWVSIVWYYVSKTAVPMYVLVSGACLLHKKDSWRKSLSRFVRILCVLLMASYAYFLLDAWLHYGLWPRAGELDAFFKLVWQQKIADSLWYLYFYLGLMVMLPFLQRMCSAMSKGENVCFVCLCFLLGGGWPLVVHYQPALALPGYFDIPLFTGYLGMFFAGHLLYSSSVPSRKQSAAACIAAALSLVLSALLTGLEYTRTEPGKPYWFMDERTMPALLTLIAAVGIAAAARGWLSGSFKPRTQRLWAELGGCSFGIYLLQQMIIQETEYRLLPPLQSVMHVFPAVLIWELAIFGIALCAAWVIRRIPGLKSLL